ncbi:MAG: DNA repair and recombination protein RadB [Thermococci archaeon]|nr:DNA repair and recombination protein RadB [Thermococci archaeon]
MRGTAGPLTTGVRSIDGILGGGFERGVLTQIYGPYATGKTTLAIQTGLLNGGYVAYVDTEGGFSPERLLRMARERGMEGDVMERFIVFTPESFAEQFRIVGNLKKIVNRTFSLVVVDSITSLYRAEDRRGLSAGLMRQLQALSWIARRNNVAVLVINQVHFDSRAGVTRPVAEYVMGYRCKDILRLDKLPMPGRRLAVLERHRTRPEGLMAKFKITEKGLEDV